MKNLLMALTVVLLATAGFGCAITDYDGIPDHKTTSEAKLWGAEISFTGFGADLDGTYSYTVKYDNRGGRDSNITIYSYRNPVPSSFSRDGVVDRDGDDVQGNAGVLGGKFNNQFVAVDGAPGCQFGANLTQDKSSTGPGIFFCDTVGEEVDKDFDLHAAFSSFDDMLEQIWTGALTGEFTMDVTALRIDGVSVPIDTMAIGARHNGTRPMQFSIENGPGVQSAIAAILANTEDSQPVTLGFELAGGLSFNMPGGAVVGFNHAALASLQE